MEFIPGVNFKESLYNDISEIGFWDSESVHITDSSLVFDLKSISGLDEFRALGSVTLDDHDKNAYVQYLNLTLILAKGIEEHVSDKMLVKLHELNTTYRYGMFYLDGAGNLCVESVFPIVRDDLEGSLRLFIAQYSNLETFINGIFPYLLRVITVPEEANFQEYIITMLEEA